MRNKQIWRSMARIIARGVPLHVYRKTFRMTENAVAKEIVDAAFRVHTVLGPGLCESVYEAVLASN